MSDYASRAARVLTMNTLSQARFLVGPDLRRANEFSLLLAEHFGRMEQPRGDEWFVTRRFWEATSFYGIEVPDRVRKHVDQNPEGAFCDYLCGGQSIDQTAALTQYENSARALVERIEGRRKQLVNESLSMRRRALSALLLLEQWTEVLRISASLGISTDDFRGSSDSFKRDLVRKSPTLHVERELTLVIEREDGDIVPNDLLDMSFFVAAIPYCDFVVGERAFVARARQAGLDQDYNTVLLTELEELAEYLS